MLFDIELQDHGTIWLAIPLTDSGGEWIQDNIPDAMPYADGVVIEHRFMPDIFKGMQEDGLRVLIPVRSIPWP